MVGVPTNRSIRTFCRVCEPACGLVAEVDSTGALSAVSPDYDHPITKGFACAKGIATFDIHVDPDRLDHPLRRGSDGGFGAVSWDDAVSDIAARLSSIIDAHGPSAVATYGGNPLSFNAVGMDALTGFERGLRLTRTFSSGTQDCANKFVASEAVFGTRTVHPIPDIERAQLIVLIGSNPRTSHGSFISIANMAQELRAARARGARVVFVDPRKIETPDRGLGDTILIRPDTDVYFLASLLAAIDDLDGFDAVVLTTHGRNVDALRTFVHRYPAERVAGTTGIPPEVVRDLAATWVAADGAAVHASTGLNMGRQGTLAYWLVQMLSFVTGNLDRPGGNFKSDSFYPNARAGAGVIETSYTDTEFGRLRHGALPGTLLSHYIVDVEQPLRALVVVAGNPLLSVAGEERHAFAHLELLVCVDIFRNATAELAHYVLPATDQFEREDLNVLGVGMQYQPWVGYTPAVVTPKAERRNEWWILARLSQALGLPSVLDSPDPDPWSKLRYMLSRGGIDLDELRRDPTPVALTRTQPGRFYEDQVFTSDGKIDCCPAVFAPALERCEELFVTSTRQRAAAAGQGAPSALLMVTKRDPLMHNSWYANVARFKQHGNDRNRLEMHPDDATARGLVDGSCAAVSSAHGRVEVEVAVSDDLMAGVVALVHGWGHAGAPGLRVASASPGVNPNALLPIGPGSFEPLSSQAHMTGIPVQVEPLPLAAGAYSGGSPQDGAR
jgi:anaerobic selenocysteine-containing dehydrogenase